MEGSSTFRTAFVEHPEAGFAPECFSLPNNQCSPNQQVAPIGETYDRNCDHPQIGLQETWKTFPEDPRYEVSDQGRVKDTKTGKITVGTISQGKANKYLRFTPKNLNRHIGVHYMVLRTFTEKPEGKYQPDHINHNTFDNRLSNLRWLTNRENTLNSSRCIIYSFTSEGKYETSYNGWKEAGKSVGVSGEYLRKRMHNNWGYDRRYATPFVGDHYFITKKIFHQSWKYLW